MRKNWKKLFTIITIFFGAIVNAQEVVPETYINPLDIDYTYMVYNSSKNISSR